MSSAYYSDELRPRLTPGTVRIHITYAGGKTETLEPHEYSVNHESGLVTVHRDLPLGCLALCEARGGPLTSKELGDAMKRYTGPRAAAKVEACKDYNRPSKRKGTGRHKQGRWDA
jgi:hypothetical protein